jgi:PilZ domain
VGKMDSPTNAEAKPDSASRTGRRNPRRKIGILAALTTTENKLLGFGAVTNISVDGAKVVLSDEIEVPDRFSLTLSNKSGPRRMCSVMWRKDKAIGVHFLPSDEK